jgi:pilus assembly protein CpaB
MAEKRYTLVFATAVAVALVATYGVYKVLQANAARSRVATRAVVIAAADIPEGGLLDQTSITTAQWPVPTIPTGAYMTPDSVVGRVTRVAIFKGEPLVPGRLAPLGASAGIEVRIPAGKRAMAIKINDVSGIAGMIQPNSRVDVLVTLRDQTTTNNKQVAKVFMENMRVLSMGSEIERDVNGRAKPATTATLEVTPDQAEHLALAAAAGQLQLVLRGFGDRDSTGTEGATARDVLAQLRGMPISAPEPRPEPRRTAAPRRPTVVQASSPPPAPQPVAAAPAKPDSATVEIYRGTKSEKQKFLKDTTQKP